MCVIVYVYIYLWLYVYINVYYTYYHNYLGIPILYPRSRIHVSAQPIGPHPRSSNCLKRSWRPATAPRPKGTAAGPERTSQNGYLAQNRTGPGGNDSQRGWIENDPKPMKYINISDLFWRETMTNMINIQLPFWCEKKGIPVYRNWVSPTWRHRYWESTLHQANTPQSEIATCAHLTRLQFASLSSVKCHWKQPWEFPKPWEAPNHPSHAWKLPSRIPLFVANFAIVILHL
jgi:hypothetical protein